MRFADKRQHEKNLRKAQRAAERAERKAARGMPSTYQRVSNTEWEQQPRRWSPEANTWIYPAVVAGKQTWTHQ